MLTTPGIAAAAEVSMPRITACACGERRKAAWAMLGSLMSSTYRPWPVISGASSLRRTDAPMPESLAVAAIALPLRRGEHGIDDVVVARAAAEVALEPVADFLLTGIRVLLEQVRGAHDHAGCAVAALQPVLLVERPLHRVQLAVLRKPLDGGDLGTVGLHREHRARLDRLAVDVHRAGAARRGVATDVGAGQAKLLTQELRKQEARLDVFFDTPAIHGQADGSSHASSSSSVAC